MAKLGRGPSLFEKLGSARPGERAARSPQPLRSSASASPSATEGSGESATRSDATARRASHDREPIASFDGDRLRFSFTSGSAAVVIFAFVGCLVGVYWLGAKYGRKVGLREGFEQGRVSYRNEVDDEIAAARRQEPRADLVAGLMDAGTQPTGDPGGDSAVTRASDDEASPWVVGLTYVVVQEFRSGNESHVEPARAFLAERGVETVPVAAGSGGWKLITKQGYNRRDATQRRLADQFLQSVHEIGKSYYAAGGGYRLEGYFITHKGDRW